MPRRSKRVQKPLPAPRRDNRVVVIQDVEYFVEWPQLDVGHSFFLPTLELPKRVEKILKPFAEELGYDFEVRARCEYGRYGVRVWRVY